MRTYGELSLDVAPTREQGVGFVVVAVARQVLDSRRDQADITALLRREFGGVEVVFMAQDATGDPTFLGRRDIVDFLAEDVFLEELPWQTLPFSES